MNKTAKALLPHANAMRERREASDATMKTWVQCAGCGRPFKDFGLLCTRCQFKPRNHGKDHDGSLD